MLIFYLSAVATDPERDKLRYIYENYYSYMEYTVRNIVRNNEAIADIVHTAMLELIERIDLFDMTCDRKVKALCGVIARNKAIDYCRAKDNNMVSFDTANVPGIIPDDSVDPEATAVSADTYEAIVRTIMDMDDTYRDVLYLKYVSEMRESEISAALGITPEAVKSRIYRGRQIIRDLLRKAGIYG